MVVSVEVEAIREVERSVTAMVQAWNVDGSR